MTQHRKEFACDFRFSRRRTRSDWLRGIWLVVVGLVFTGATLVADDHEADKAKSPTPGGLTTRRPDSGRGAAQDGRDFPGGRCARRAGARDQRHRGVRPIHRRHLQEGRAQAGPGRGLFPAVHDRRASLPRERIRFGVRRPGRRGDQGQVQRPTSRRWRSARRESSKKCPSSSPATASRPRTVRLKLDYDDYAGIDVKGKAVLIIRREPQQDDQSSPFEGKRTTASRPSSTRRPTPFSTVRPRSSSSTISPACKGEKDQLLHVHGGGHRVDFDHSRS